MVTINIDNKEIKVEPGTTILEAATAAGIKIPTLCHMDLKELKCVNNPGACRICVVEVEGRRNLAPSCKTNVSEGMKIRTNTQRVLNARHTVMELILSDHPKDCLTCSKNGNCELQDVSKLVGMHEIRYAGEESKHIADISPSIIRDMDKCIMCRRCETVCNTVQSVGALTAINRGFGAVVGTAFNREIKVSTCTNCGQCVAMCPTGALSEHPHIREVQAAIHNSNKTVIVQTAPAVRVALGNDYGYEAGSDVTGQMVTALRQLGFDYVFDTNFAADVTIMEEGTELLGRITDHIQGKESVLPLTTSCCPAWVSFMETHYPELLDHVSTTRSPQQIFGAIAKTYFAKKKNIKREDLVVVSVMPCVAKKYECERPEFATDNDPDVDYSITTRELAHMIQYCNIDFKHLKEDKFDSPLGEATGAGAIFGTTGGVIEAAVRTAYEVLTKHELPRVDFQELRGFEGIRTATIYFDQTPINIAIAHGLHNARQLVEEIKEGKSKYHAIEVMSCPGGCIGGGGQPYHHGDIDVIRKRQKALYKIDQELPLRKSHENPSVLKLYKDFLGEPNGEMSHKLLHTHYFNRQPKIKPTKG